MNTDIAISHMSKHKRAGLRGAHTEQGTVQQRQESAGHKGPAFSEFTFPLGERQSH